jgi:hypothetical protein
MTPTARTLAKLRKDGWTAGVVERFNPHVGEHGIRQDFLGCIDIIAVREGETLGVQACSVGDQTNRMKKLEASPGAAAWLTGGVRRLEVWGWGKRKLKRGGKAIRWQATVRDVTPAPVENEP